MNKGIRGSESDDASPVGVGGDRKNMGFYAAPYEIDRENARNEKRVSEGTIMRANTVNRLMDARNRLIKAGVPGVASTPTLSTTPVNKSSVKLTNPATPKNIMKSYTDLMDAQKAIIIIAKKRGVTTTQKPDDEIGEDDLPKGRLKYDEVPDVNNMLGEGGPGRVICTDPLSTGGGMMSNTIMGNEIVRSLAEAAKKVSEKAGKDGESPQIKTKTVKNKSKADSSITGAIGM